MPPSVLEKQYDQASTVLPVVQRKYYNIADVFQIFLQITKSFVMCLKRVDLMSLPCSLDLQMQFAVAGYIIQNHSIATKRSV
jgi:hypothetical protein